MINLGKDESPAKTQKDIQKYTKEIKEQNLKIEIEQLKSSMAIYIIFQRHYSLSILFRIYI